MYTYTSELAAVICLAIGQTYPSANNELVISDTKSIVFRAEDQFLGFRGSLASTSEMEYSPFSSCTPSDDDALAAISCVE
jgi:hypothetical protein